MSRRLNARYTLSEEGMETLMKRLEKLALETAEADDQFTEATITTDFVKRLTKVSGVEEVIDNNEELTKKFQGLINMYGFETMYDMYMYAMSCDTLTESIQKAKDYSKLTPVKRKVMRNGKEQEVTVWVKPDGEGEKEESDSTATNARGTGTTQRRRGKRAQEMSSGVIRDSDANPKKLAEIENAARSLPQGNKPFKEGSQYFLEIRDENSQVVGVVAYSEDGEYLTMDYYRTNGEVSGVAAKGFFELMKLGHELEKGVKMEDIQEARPLFIQSGLEHHDQGYWYIEKDELAELLGFPESMEPNDK